VKDLLSDESLQQEDEDGMGLQDLMLELLEEADAMPVHMEEASLLRV
jgi:hypothetical protein